jgi:hypothetical protein
MKRLGRVPSQISESLHKRLSAYALAASAAAVGMLAPVQPAEGKIVYTPIHHVIKPNSYYNLDLNNDGTVEFVIEDKFGDGVASLYIHIPTGSNYAGFEAHGHNNTPLALRKGATIGGSRTFAANFGTMARARFGSSGTFFSSYYWASVTNRYLGFSFVFNHQRHFGWARLSVKISRKTAKITATLTGYAYETIPDRKMIAGKTHSADDVEQPAPASLKSLTQQPGSLGALAMGAPGLSIWRREESALQGN